MPDLSFEEDRAAIRYLDHIVSIVVVRERNNFSEADLSCNSLCSSAIEWSGSVFSLLMAGNSFLGTFMAVGE